MMQIAICTSGGWNTGVHAICKLEIQLFRKKGSFETGRNRTTREPVKRREEMKRVHTPSHGRRKGGHHSTYYCSNMLSVCHRKRDLLNLRRSIHSRKETVHKTTLHPQRPHDDHNKTKQSTDDEQKVKS